MIADVANAGFEFFGGVFMAANVLKLHADKRVRGVYWPATLFFTSWGWWNIYYYAALAQWWSWGAGLFLSAVSTFYLAQMIYYVRRA